MFNILFKIDLIACETEKLWHRQLIFVYLLLLNHESDSLSAVILCKCFPARDDDDVCELGASSLDGPRTVNFDYCHVSPLCNCPYRVSALCTICLGYVMGERDRTI